MSEHGAARTIACVVTAVLLGAVAFGGTAFADDDDSGEGHRSGDIVRGTPCTSDAVACVSLGAQRAWLFTDGQISYGPVPVSTGAPGKQTPVGDHVVQWKHKNHTTNEFKTPQGKPAPMPYAVFFAEGGVAFHEGTLNRRSAGCVRLNHKDAEFFYNFLKLGDTVEVRG
ncbi:MAG: L,D-transpeptidase [Pseudonocardia sp.]|nr:L,D-transpeptidase [Pseudonocardia sp.]MBO0874363.1 L,D-transpeptidase [Pseudonocardia sp.]